jgi:hypothetical protein
MNFVQLPRLITPFPSGERSWTTRATSIVQLHRQEQGEVVQRPLYIGPCTTTSPLADNRGKKSSATSHLRVRYIREVQFGLSGLTGLTLDEHSRLIPTVRASRAGKRNQPEVNE